MGQTASNLTCHSCSCHDLDLLSAARSGDTQQLQQTLEGQPVMLLLANLQGTGLLHVAAQEGRLETIKLLLDMIKGHAPALAAAVSACSSKRQQQQQRHKDQHVQQQQQFSSSGKANSKLKQLLRLKRSAWSGANRRQVKQLTNPRLLLHTLVNWQNNRGVTPLMLACRGNHAPSVSLLLSYGADPLMVDKITRRTCLHYAAVAGATSCVNVLLHEWRQVLVLRRGREQRVLLQEVKLRDGVTGTNRYIDLRSSSGFSPLHLATYWGHTSTVKALLAAGASTMLSTADRLYCCSELLVGRGSNALHIAAANGHVGAAVAILQSHVESMAQVVPRPLSFTHRPATTAAAAVLRDQQQEGGNPEHQQQQQQRLPWEGCPRMDPRAAVSSSGTTPAAVAARMQQPEALLLLLDTSLPVTHALRDTGLMTAAPIKLPTLAVIAKSALDQHLNGTLDRLEAQQQQQLAPGFSAAGDTAAIAADPDAVSKVTVAEASFAKSDMITVCWELSPSSSCSSMLSLGDHQAVDTSGSSSSSASSSCSQPSPTPSGTLESCQVSSDTTELMIGELVPSGARNNGGCDSNLDDSFIQSPACSDCCSSDESDCTCGICFEAPCSVMIAGCKHSICLGCARSVVTVTTSCKPAVCPFCRQAVDGFASCDAMV